MRLLGWGGSCKGIGGRKEKGGGGGGGWEVVHILSGLNTEARCVANEA